MEIRYPSYYKKFQCVAGDCPDTCCAGWEIPVDPASEKRYRDAQKSGKIKNREFVRKLKNYIKDGRILSDDVTCPFLNRDGLCDMYIELGPESLCHTCKRHPRHLEDYGNLHEMVLLLSCPEAARLVLEENAGEFYVWNIPERRGNMDGIDEELLNLLLQIREQIWDIVKNRSFSIEVRMAFVLALGHDIQRRMQTNDYDGIRSVLVRYKNGGAEKRFVSQWRRKKSLSKTNDIDDQTEEGFGRFLLMADFMEEFSSLETICRDWPDLLEKTRTDLYHSRDSRKRYHEKRESLLKEKQDCKEDCEKLFCYFIYSFFLSALYDGDVLTKAKMAVLCTMGICEIYTNAESLTLKDRANICHALARQIENSNENRKHLEQILKQEVFGARRICDALLEE